MSRVSATLLLCLAIWTLPAAALQLTPDEQQWLRDNPELRLGIDNAWPPFEFRDKQGQYSGLAADYVQLIEQRLNIRLTPAPLDDWSEVMKQARAGQLHLLPAVMATPERQQYLSFTRPYLDFPIVILTHEQGPQPRNLRELSTARVAVVADYAPHELLRSLHPQIQLLPRPTVSAALLALSTGEADAMVGDLASSVWNLRQLKLDGILVNGETPYRYQLTMAAPKDQAILIGILDKVFADLGPAQMQALQDKWVQGLIDRRPFWRSLLLFGLPGLLIALAIIASILRINQRLRQEMTSRSRLEEQLRHSEAHYRGLVENLNAVAWQMRPSDFCFTYVAPQAEKWLGYPLHEWLQPDFLGRVMHPDDMQRTLDYCRSETLAGRDHSMDYRMRAADGRVIWVRDIVTLSTQAVNEDLRGLMIDITAEKTTEQALALSEQKFASVFHNCPDVIALIDMDSGRLLEVNHTFEQQFGISAAEAIGHTSTELGLWIEQGIGPRILQMLRERNLHNIEGAFRRRDGGEFTGLISAQKIALANRPTLVVVVRDISELKDTQQRLQLSETKFAKAFHASPDGLLITRVSDGHLLDVNQGFSQITGYSIEEASESSTVQLGIWDDPEDRLRMIGILQKRGSVASFCANIRRKDGSLRYCEMSVQPMQVGGDACMLTIARDITERTQMQERLQQAATVFESTAEGVMITDIEQRITAVNRAFTSITGYSESEALGQSPRLLASGNHDSAFFVRLWHSLAASGHWQGEIWNKRRNGELFPSWLTISTVHDDSGRITHFVGVFADISSLKHAQARLDHQAHHDSLTGLPNRMLFEARLRHALEEARQESLQGAVLFIDLDRFKHINDSLGHPVGDLLLKSIALRLKNQLRDIDTVARLGGDEFIILLPGLHAFRDAEQVAQKLLGCFNQPFKVDTQELFISASIGISLYPEDGDDVASLIKHADAAMYRSKARGRNRIERYTRDLTFQATERVAMERELRRAIEQNQLQLYYQPKRSLRDQSLVGAEALLRWHHPEFGEIAPDRFIPLAEETGLIIPLGDWVLEQACRQMQQWHNQHAPFGPLSVNLTGIQLRQPHLLQRIASLLEDHQLPASLLQLEITESFIMNQAEEALSLLHQLKALGVHLAIDDFGTGYSSLSSLKRLPVDTLKIDRSFVSDLPDDANDAAITRAIIALGRSMQLTVIAEGVETKSQELFLAAEGCEQIQGFVISRPIPADAFAQNFLEPRHAVGAGQTASV